MLLLCGSNDHMQLGEESNNKDIHGKLAINPPINSHLQISSLLSFSCYDSHSVAITNDGELMGVGDNTDGRIIGSLPRKIFKEFTKFFIKDNNGQSLHPISAVCGSNFTLYIISQTKDSNETLLAYSYTGIKTASPLFLNIGNSNPVSLFGGFDTAAAVDEEGSVIFVPKFESSFAYSPLLLLEKNRLPNTDESVVCVSCCIDFVFAVGSTGSVYESAIPKRGSRLSFRVVESLKEEKVVEVNGSYRHCFAVTEDGRVFGRGENFGGQLAIGDEIQEANLFVEIEALKGLNIKHAYAGMGHSLFQTDDGNLLECGSNGYGELISHSPCRDSFCKPMDTRVTKSATFCIAGNCVSAVFIGSFPPKCPNYPIVHKNGFLSESSFLYGKRIRQRTKSQRNQIQNIAQIVDNSKHHFDSFRSNMKNIKRNLERPRSSIEDPRRGFDGSRNRIHKSTHNADNLRRSFDGFRNTNHVGDRTRDIIEHDQILIENERLLKENSHLRECNSLLREENESLRSTIIDLLEKVNKSTDVQNVPTKLRIFEQETINKMKIGEVIGRNSYSEVVKVTFKDEFALKILHLRTKHKGQKPGEIGVDTSKVKLFLKESEIIQSLHHPNIIELYGFCYGNEKHPPSILLQFCPGNLCDIVEEMSPFEKVCSIFEISLGMKAAHEKGLIHRDLKPSNILIDNSNHVRVSDFGFSCFETAEGQSRSISSGFGATKFMAPELLNEDCSYTKKVDVYSFGVIAFYILTGGELPKIGIVELASGKKAKIPDEINEISKKLITSCWSMKAEDRPSFGEIVDFIKSNDFKLVDGIENEINRIKFFVSI